MSNADPQHGRDAFNRAPVGRALLADEWIQYAMLTLQMKGWLKEDTAVDKPKTRSARHGKIA